MPRSTTTLTVRLPKADAHAFRLQAAERGLTLNAALCDAVAGPARELRAEPRC